MTATIPDTMKALLLGRGPEWVLDDVPAPRPGRGEILVRNRAAATNNADLPMLAEADPTSGGTGAESIAGFEYAGEVAAVGENAGPWQVGDAVMGSIGHCFAEYVVADHRFVLPRPEGLAPEVACALPTGLLTEQGALAAAGFRSGQSVLVTGASSAIGHIGVQMAMALGASRRPSSPRRTTPASTSSSTTSPDRPSPTASPRPPSTATSSTSAASPGPRRTSTSTRCRSGTSPSTASRSASPARRRWPASSPGSCHR